MYIFSVKLNSGAGQEMQVVTAQSEEEVEEIYGRDVVEINNEGPYITSSAYNTVRDQILC